VEAWNFGVRATGKPWASAVINEYACALRWNRGRQAHSRWWPPRPIQPGKDRPVSVYDACRTRTPLGRLVVPEVYTIAAGLNGSSIAGPAAGWDEATSMASRSCWRKMIRGRRSSTRYSISDWVRSGLTAAGTPPAQIAPSQAWISPGEFGAAIRTRSAT